MWSSLAVVAIFLTVASSNTLRAGSWVVRVKRSSTVHRVCEPGTTFLKDCNTCHCNSQGSDAVCTLKKCYKTCRPGTVQFVRCNACLCHENRWKCTTKICPPKKGPTRCQALQDIEEDTSFCLPDDPTCGKRRN